MFSTVGRFHPLLVHLPIGILLIAFLFELLSRFRGYRKLKFAVQPALFVGALSAVLSALTGFGLSQEGGYDERLLRNHQYLGVATAVFAVLIYLHRKYSIIPDKTQRRAVRMIFFIILIVLLVLTGHFGGSLTHGEDFLSAPTPEPALIKESGPMFTGDPQQAGIFDIGVRPILEQKCFTCHSSKKQKGKLRLDTREWIEKGGKHGAVLTAGKPSGSELFKRISLPVDMEHHMPPRERKQLSSLELDVIEAWIEAGASFEKKIAELPHPEIILEFIRAGSNQVPDPDLPDTEVGEIDPETIGYFKKSGAVIIPVTANSNYVKISFEGRKEITPADVNQVHAIAGNIIELNLSRSKVPPQLAKSLVSLPELRALVMQGSDISDDGIRDMGVLKKLKYFNLSQTAISDKAVPYIGRLTLIKKIYLYGTGVTAKGAADLHELLPDAQIDRGNYQLPFIPSDTVVYKRSRPKP